jgi:hypothetical protein
MKNGGWTLAKPNTISMPVPNLVSVVSPMSLGGVTYWNGAGNKLPVTLGDGTFLVCNQAYYDLDAGGNYGPGIIFTINLSYGAAAPLYEMSLRQGVGVTYPSGNFNIIGQVGNTILNWTSFVGSNALDSGTLKYIHQGWAIKLSGVTSGGLGSGGGFGGGIQSG